MSEPVEENLEEVVVDKFIPVYEVKYNLNNLKPEKIENLENCPTIQQSERHSLVVHQPLGQIEGPIFPKMFHNNKFFVAQPHQFPQPLRLQQKENQKKENVTKKAGNRTRKKNGKVVVDSKAQEKILRDCIQKKKIQFFVKPGRLRDYDVGFSNAFPRNARSKPAKYRCLLVFPKTLNQDRIQNAELVVKKRCLITGKGIEMENSSEHVTFKSINPRRSKKNFQNLNVAKFLVGFKTAHVLFQEKEHAKELQLCFRDKKTGLTIIETNFFSTHSRKTPHEKRFWENLKIEGTERVGFKKKINTPKIPEPITNNNNTKNAIHIFNPNITQIELNKIQQNTPKTITFKAPLPRTREVFIPSSPESNKRKRKRKIEQKNENPNPIKKRKIETTPSNFEPIN